jgi:SAM-dependent methyltransferase
MMDATGGHILDYPRGHDEALAELLDPFTRDRIAALLDLHGKRVLEVGAGGGSIAGYLADEVGPAGQVFAVDTRPRLPFTHPQVTVFEADATTDYPPANVDLVHARLTLAHIPQREAVLAKLIDCLNPGGVILIEDWWAANTDMVMHARRGEDAELYHRFQTVLGGLFERGGTDRGWARRIHGALLDAGLVDVRTVIHATAWSGASPGCRLIRTAMGQLWDRLIAAGLTHDELLNVTELLDDPHLVVAGHPLYSTSGHRAF